MEKLAEKGDIELIKSNARIIAFNYAYLIICFIFLKRVLSVHYKDDAEVGVFNYWIDRLIRSYREPMTKDE